MPAGVVFKPKFALPHTANPGFVLLGWCAFGSVMMRSPEPINQNISQLQQLQFSSVVQFGF